MRSERQGHHISGAERLLTPTELGTAAVEMLQRALLHSRGQGERIVFRVEEISLSTIQQGRLPDLFNNQVADWAQGRELARECLKRAGVSLQAIENAMAALEQGPAPDGRSMRGAMLIDAETGERLEEDPTRGVRASRMDLTPRTRRQLCTALGAFGLNNLHVIEALTLAAKVIVAPGMVAELCWSDDPDYLAGYVASDKLGYQRINLLKPAGEERGGRAFFVTSDRSQIPALVEWLEKQPILFERIGRVHAPRKWPDEL